MYRLPIESLEYRRLLTAFVVDTISDDADDLAGTMDGQISLREAIIASNTNAAFGDAPAGSGADVITFADPAGTIELNNGQLTITESVTLDGQAGNVTVSGKDATRLFNIATSGAVTLTNLNLINGQSADVGGAISLTGGGVTVLDRVNIGNSAALGLGGGGIYNADHTLTLKAVTLSENSATGVSGSGGGLLSDAGKVEIYDSRIIGNTANRAGGGIEQTTGSLRLERTELGGPQLSEGNITGPVGSANPGNGGGYHSTGATDVTIIGGLVQNNSAGREGGGLWNSATSTMRVQGGVVISDNIALGDAADDGGGGIFNNGGTLLVENSTINDNTATGLAGSGGGIFSTAGSVSVIRSTIDGNKANRAGGGIELTEGSLSFSGSRLSANIAGEGESSNPGNGGGLHVTGATTVLVTKSRVTENEAGSEGGGLWNSATGTMTVMGTLVDDNKAHGNGADEGGGGLFNNGGRVIVDTTSFDDNVADGTAGSGGGLFSTAGDVDLNRTQFNRNIANRAGGGIEVIAGNLLLQRSLMYDNVAGPTGTAAPGNGGGIHVTGPGAEVTVSKSTVERNIAALEGGGLWNAAESTMNVVGSAIVRNIAQGAAADDGGGGIFNNGGDMSIDYSTIGFNKADGMSGSGGGLFSTAGDISLYKTTFDGNVANRAGGGIELIDGTLNANQAVLARNVTGPAGSSNPGNGGAVHVTGNGDVNLLRSWVRDNRAGREGGGLWNALGTTTLRGTSVTDNIAYGAAADDGGGGIFANAGDVQVLDSSFVGRNKAEGTLASGGGIFVTSAATLTVRDSRVERNSAVRWGGGIFNDNQIRVEDSRVTRNFAGVTGGGIFTDDGATSTLVSATVTGNSPNNFAGSGTIA